MVKLDQDLLNAVGLGTLPAQYGDLVLKQIYSTLEFRVGVLIAGRMNNDQLGEFEQFVEVNNQPAALLWLENNVADYREIVSQAFDELKLEVAAAADEIALIFDEYQQLHPSAGERPKDTHDMSSEDVEGAK